MTRSAKAYKTGAGHAKIVIVALRDLGYTVAYVLDDAPAKWGQTLSGVPIRGPIAAILDLPLAPTVIPSARPYRKNWIAHVGPGRRLAGGVSLGEGTLVGAGATIIPETRVGACCTVGAGAAVISDIPEGSLAAGLPARIKLSSVHMEDHNA